MRKRSLLAVAVVIGVGSAPVSWARTDHFVLTVSVSGPGHVTAQSADPGGGSIDCPGRCSLSTQLHVPITLTATPDTSATFTGWGGECSGLTPFCTVTMTAARSVSASFSGPSASEPPPPPTPQPVAAPPPPPTFMLTVKKTGTGSGFVGGAGIDCGPTCAMSLPEASTVSLVAVSNPGSEFTGWSGACKGTAACTLEISADTAVTAVFADRAPPVIATLSATARRGGIAELRFRVFDDSGRSSEQLTVWDGSTRLASIRLPIRTVVYRRVYASGWPVPSRLSAGPRRFCATAVDPAGNRSRRSCSPLAIT